MANSPYRWHRAWCLIGDEGDFTVGGIVTTQKSNGETEPTEIAAVVPFTTAKGERKVRAYPAGREE